MRISIDNDNRLQDLQHAMVQDGFTDRTIKVLPTENGHAFILIKDGDDTIARLSSYRDRASIETEDHMGVYRDEAAAYNAALANLHRLAGDIVHRTSELEVTVTNENSKPHARIIAESVNRTETLTNAMSARNESDPDLWMAVAEAARDIAKMAERAAQARS